MELVKIRVGGMSWEALPGETGVQKGCGKGSIRNNSLRMVAEMGRVEGMCLGCHCERKWSLNLKNQLGW